MWIVLWIGSVFHCWFVMWFRHWEWIKKQDRTDDRNRSPRLEAFGGIEESR